MKTKPTKTAVADTSSAPSAPITEDESIDITIIKFTPENEEKLGIRKGVDITIDKPWKSVQKDLIISVLKSMEKFQTAKRLNNYDKEEVLVGYQTDMTGTDGHLICLTDKGRERILFELSQLHVNLTEKVRQYLNRESSRPPPAEKPVQIAKKERPPITYEWVGQIEPRLEQKDFQSDIPPFYSRILCRDKESIELVQSAVLHAEVLATPTVKDCSVQTEPEITINDCTQFVPEIDLPQFTGLTPEQEKQLAKVCQAYSDQVMEATSYNSLFDLYKDDYSELLQIGEPLTISKSGSYTHYMSFNDISQFEGKILTSLTWHAEKSGMIAVSYGKQSANNVVRLDSDSEEENYHSRGLEMDIWAKSKSILSVSDKDKTEKIAWMKMVKKIDQLMNLEYSEDEWLASESFLDSIEKACRIREFEALSEKSREDAIPFEDAGPEEYDIYYVPYETDIEINHQRMKNLIKEIIDKDESMKE